MHIANLTKSITICIPKNEYTFVHLRPVSSTSICRTSWLVIPAYMASPSEIVEDPSIVVLVNYNWFSYGIIPWRMIFQFLIKQIQ